MEKEEGGEGGRRRKGGSSSLERFLPPLMCLTGCLTA